MFHLATGIYPRSILSLTGESPPIVRYILLVRTVNCYFYLFNKLLHPNLVLNKTINSINISVKTIKILLYLNSVQLQPIKTVWATGMSSPFGKKNGNNKFRIFKCIYGVPRTKYHKFLKTLLLDYILVIEIKARVYP